MRVPRSKKNPFRPYLACRKKDSCRYFRWADEELYYMSHHHQQRQHYEPNVKERLIIRPKLQRQNAMVETAAVKRNIPP